jgi:signal transduction histidine kinase/ActR/RegA family two-component response regulator
MKRLEGPALSTNSNSDRPPRRNAASPQLDMIQLLADAGFTAVFESSAEMLVVTDSAGALQRANAPACAMLRLQAADVHRAALGDFVSVPIDGNLRRLAVSDPPSQAAKSIETTLTTGFPIRITLRSILPGSHHLLLCLEEGSIVQRAESKWRQVEAELRSVLDSVAVGVVLIDSSGHLRYSSARFGLLFGIDVRTLGDITEFDELDDLLAKRLRDPQAFSAPWKSYAAGAGEPGHDELEIMRPTRRVLERFFRPVLDAEGRQMGWLELCSDVTGERQIQSKLIQTEKMAALGQLVSGIAHELNNPLTAIMGYAQLLLGHGLMPPQLTEANRVYQEAERARRIVKNLLYFARENRPERSVVDLNEIVERTFALRSYELRVENIAIDFDLADDLPKTMADPYQLQQVVLNLVINAEQSLLEGRGQGNVWIRTSWSPASGPHWGAGRILLEISDDGPGIAPEIASRIFDPFFTTKPSGVGTGLGLSIVYGIVHQHGGEVTFENQPGSGVKFVVEIPVVAVREGEPIPLSSSSDDPSRASPTGRILVVEDEPVVAQLIVDVLREEGHQVEAVLDSQEGLTRISRAEYDLVICDLRMPRLDGPAFYDALVRAGSSAQTRILFVTGDTLASRTLDFLEPNGLPYLAKPFLVEELKLAVNRLLDQTRREPVATVSSISKVRSAPGRV